MEYTNGLVAFIDILGFSNYVYDDCNVNKTNDIFEFVQKFQYLFNTSPKLKTKVAFFSDSLVLTTPINREEGLSKLATSIWIAESYLRKNTNLLFRGAITKGDYYHEGAIAFGPAIVNSYKLEKEAKYARILIADDIMNEGVDVGFNVERDFDGRCYLNLFALSLYGNTPGGQRPSKNEVLDTLPGTREEICKLIKMNYNTPVSDKYLWRIIPFNKSCDKTIELFNELSIAYDDNDVDFLNRQKISFNEFK